VFVLGVSAHDPAVLATAMPAAYWLPARRASRVDPLRALRQD